ncbi:hypothetical protein [Pseudanabaena sp. FACHB-2040]|uniref:hypothetical protein n=1 Tax=Pseudanabaena sp. FACHB-2040 TaxID=2692859 RepID=UPI001683E01F|nr:hypothetical protein [Pseudanabaena sp. FACHB-2040]MBD2259235.1 hypothetical protein [Pseudanabaena sp. FACHB-2040]
MSAPSVPSSAPKNCTECPNCGKYSIVYHRDEIYRCLNCDFERVLNSTEADKTEEGNPLSLMISTLGFVLMLLLFL